MSRVALIADSHVPERAEEEPAEFRDRIRAADHVIHAGDFTSGETLDRFRSMAEEFTAVFGNMDPRGLDLPAVATTRVEGLTFVVTHGTGDPRGYEERVAGIVREDGGPDAIGVAGHTHEVLDTTREDVRLLNPGSVTGAAPADRATMMTVDVEGETLSVTVHEA